MPKRKSIKLEEPKLFVEKVLDRYDEDLLDRTDWADARLQRYAKLFGWLEGKSYPWPNASDQHIPMLMTNSQRTQDTLVNAVLASRPVMSAIAVNKADADKGKTIDELQDYQLFIEQDGEEKIASMADSFTNDGRWVCFVPWVKEKRKAREIRPVPPIPTGSDPLSVYNQVLDEIFPTGMVEKTGPYTFKITIVDPKDPYAEDQEKAEAEFYTDEDGDTTYVCITQNKVIFDGPCPIPKPLEDIICPSRCENLQPPGPSNPLGADHVIMVDYPQWDEINRLAKGGYYDLLTDEDLEALEGRVEGEIGSMQSDMGSEVEQHKIQKDALAGQTYGNAGTTSKVFTRLTYFGRWQVKKGDFEEEVVARVIMGPDRGIKALARLRYLEEEFPRQDLSRPRPFASSPAFIPIPGQWFGMGMLELLEHMQDLTKILLDQMIDKHTICNMPFFFYRAGSNIRPENINMAPGVGYPVSNPQQDVYFPQPPMNDQTIALNLIALIQQWSERQSMQGALQMGGVPQGKASALRTSSNMMSVMQQGDARPERILRRFFVGLANLYQQMHELNKTFLSPGKQYRITGIDKGADPYKQINDAKDISGIFQFDFKANTLNTSKGMKNQILSELMPMLVNGMTLQMGLVTQEEVYNILKDIVQSAGQDESRYIKTPPNANIPKVTAEQAMQQMMMGELPSGRAAEGAQIHLQSLQQLMQDPRVLMALQGDQNFQVIFKAYTEQVKMQLMQEQQQAQAAQQFAGAMGGGGAQGEQPGPQGQVDPQAGQMGMQQGPGQVSDESLPGAKGMV